MASTTRQALLQALSAAEGAYISGQHEKVNWENPQIFPIDK